MADTDTRDQVKEITDRLETGMKDLFTSEKYLSYLQTMSRFRRYSTRNTLLIHMQMPSATRVGGFGMWKEKFGRNVVKGEKGIRIFAPVMHTVKKEMNKLDPDTKAPLLDEYGDPITEEREVTIPRYKVVSVFDVQQTSGKPLPQLVEDLTGDVSQYETFMDTLKEISPLPIVFEELEANTDGLCRYGNNIAIRKGMSEIQTVCAVIHEITHALLHDNQRDENGMSAKPKDVKIQELESESVSYAVCQYYNIETSPNSLGYLASWCEDKEMSELKASLDTIRKTAATLIDKIDAKFREISKEREQHEAVPVVSDNYRALMKLAPDVLNGTYDYMEYHVGITSAPLSFAEVADGRYSLANFTFENGEIIRSPDMEIEVDSVNHTANAVSLTLNGDPVAADDGERLNSFLLQWLANIETQGYNKTRTYSFNYGNGRTDIYFNTSGKPFAIGCGHMGNGLTVWNRLEESNGDYKTIAHINADRMVKFYESDLPETIIEKVTDIAKTTEMNVSATQDTPVFDAPPPEQEYCLPDPEISITDRNSFGYTNDDILPLTYERAVELFNDDHTVYMLYPDNTEGMAFDIDELSTHDGIFGIEREEWESTRAFAEMLAANKNSEASKESLLIYGGGDTFGIYQLRHGEELRDYRWESLNSLEQHGLSVERGNYELVYTAPLTAADTPDSLYERFNAARPPDFTGHSLSVSDVLVFQRGGEVTSRYVDDFGFAELLAFLGCEKQHEITAPIQPDISSAPSVAELEAQVKAGQSISLLDLSNAVNREQKPKTSGKTSILSALEENKKIVAQSNRQPIQKRDNNLEVAT